MTPVEAITAIGAQSVAIVPGVNGSGVATQQSAPQVSFGEMLGKGITHVEQKISEADHMVRAFALDESIPVHQVTIALEEARIAIELAMQVRTRLVEAYREIMNTQL